MALQVTQLENRTKLNHRPACILVTQSEARALLALAITTDLDIPTYASHVVDRSYRYQLPADILASLCAMGFADVDIYGAHYISDAGRNALVGGR